MQQQSAPPPITTTTTKTTVRARSYEELLGYVIIGFLPTVIFAAGAAKLSYDRFQSVGWAIVAFFFSGLYYPYYALFVSKPTSVVNTMGSTVLGAARRLRR